MVSIVIPVAREGEDFYQRISLLHERLATLAKRFGVSYEIILISDVLHRPTIRAMIRLAKRGIARALFLTQRIGKGGSIKNAIPYARGDSMVLLDADVPAEPETILLALLRAWKSGADLLIANRVYRAHGALRKLLSVAFNTLVNMFFGTGLRDHQAGFKILSRKVAKVILVGRTRTDGLAYDTEIIVWARKHGFRYTTIDVVWREQRLDSTIPTFRALMTMLADLLMLRLLILRRKYVALRRVAIGQVVELNKLQTLGPEFMTVIRASGFKKHVLDVLRIMYLAIAFRRKRR